MKRLYVLVFAILTTLSISARDWKEILESGVLKVGMRSTAQIVYRPTDSTKPGLMYSAIKDFAEEHGLQLQIENISSFADYWREGDDILLKNNRITTPDIYSRVDIAAEIFTVTNRRKELINMTPFLENVELIFGNRSSGEIDSYNDLIGKRVLLFEDMSFFNLLIKELNKRNLPYRMTPIKPFEGGIQIPLNHVDSRDSVNIYLIPSGADVDGAFSYHPVARGMVDIGINDGIAVMVRIFNNSDYRENLKLLFPAQDNITQLAWGSRHEDIELNKMLHTFWNEYKYSAAFSNNLKKYLGMNLDEYHHLIKIMN